MVLLAQGALLLDTEGGGIAPAQMMSCSCMPAAESCAEREKVREEEKGVRVGADERNVWAMS